MTNRRQDLEPGQTEAFAPQPGQTFLQVAAELHDSAASAASVLNKAGFNAHVVLAPGGKLFRVLVGPVKDKNDLAATRDALKAKGLSASHCPELLDRALRG